MVWGTMRDKWILITGGTQGIGLETALGLAKQQANVAVLGRNAAAGERTVAALRDAGSPTSEFWKVDLSSQSATWTFAHEFQNAHSRLDVLVNNVGAAFPQRTETVDLIESTLAVNHIAPFLVTQLLLPLLRQSPAARIVNVNSELHRQARPPVDHDPQSRTGYNAMKAYAHAKFVNLLWSYELARQVGSRVTVNALHPGIARTALTESGAFPAVFSTFLRVFDRWNSPSKAARTSIYLASSQEVAGVTGKYFKNSVAVQSSKWTYDRVLMTNAWDLSLNLTGTVRGGRSIGRVTAPPGLQPND
jgi:retinol dehydrogenase 14